MTEGLSPVTRLSRDIADAAASLSDDEARYLVDAYYLMQEGRKRSNNQARAMKAEPNTTIAWLAEQNETLENQIKRALDRYSSAHPVGEWMKAIYGIGPVIAAGMLAHIDITKAPTAGHIWRFAGLDPTVRWEKGQKRPWNASLKTLCWKTGQSFMKFSNEDECFYGRLYRERKEFEVARNDSGDNKDVAARILVERKIDKKKEAYKSLSIGKLPPGQIDARARRWAVKLFLSHLQVVWCFVDSGSLPPAPYVISHLGHAHRIMIPSSSVVPGLDEALSR